MADDDRDKPIDDLFGDLDEFFAPIGERKERRPSKERPKPEDRSESEDRPQPPPEEAAPPKTPPEEAEFGEVADDLEDWAPEIDIPDEDELLAATGDEEEEQQPVAAAAAAAAAEAGPTEPEPPEPSQPAEPSSEPPPVEPSGEDEDWVTEATAEMSGDEWDQLRGALEGEGGGPPEEPEEPEEPAAAEGGDQEELTVDDLRAAPPQYADLPRPDEEEPVLAEEAEIEAPDLEEPVPEEIGVPEFEGEPEEEEVTSIPELEDEEPTAERISEAANHFAEGLGSPDEVERDLLADLEDEPAPAAAEPPPTWQEPASREVIEEEELPPAEPPTRNLPAAFASGVILAVAAIALLAIGKAWFAALAIGIILLGQGELYAAFKERGYQPATALGLVAGLFILVGGYIEGGSLNAEFGGGDVFGEAAMAFGLAIGAVFSVLWYMAVPANARKGLVANVGITVLGILYVPFLAGFALLLLSVPETAAGDLGRNFLLSVIGLTILYDVSAYAAGTVWGRRPMAPTISPRKSWEGALGATLLLLFVAIAVLPSVDPFTAPRAVGLALVISVAAPLGDLVESALKRDLGIKDMGSLLPGHGGVLDRVDALLFALPASYYYLQLIF